MNKWKGRLFATGMIAYPVAMLMWFTPLDKYSGLVMGAGLLAMVIA